MHLVQLSERHLSPSFLFCDVDLPLVLIRAAFSLRVCFIPIHILIPTGIANHVRIPIHIFIASDISVSRALLLLFLDIVPFMLAFFPPLLFSSLMLLLLLLPPLHVLSPLVPLLRPFLLLLLLTIPTDRFGCKMIQVRRQ